MKERFDRLGPTARICLDYTEHNVRDFESGGQHSCIDTTPDLDAYFRDSYFSADQLKVTDGMKDVSHKIFLIRRKDDRDFSDHVVTLMTDDVKEQLRTRLLDDKVPHTFSGRRSGCGGVTSPRRGRALAQLGSHADWPAASTVNKQI